MNSKRLIFWTNKKVFAVSFKNLKKTDYNLREPDFELTHCFERYPYIQNVRSSNDKDGKYIAICIRK